MQTLLRKSLSGLVVTSLGILILAGATLNVSGHAGGEALLAAFAGVFAFAMLVGRVP